MSSGASADVHDATVNDVETDRDAARAARRPLARQVAAGRGAWITDHPANPLQQCLNLLHCYLHLRNTHQVAIFASDIMHEVLFALRGVAAKKNCYLDACVDVMVSFRGIAQTRAASLT